MTVTRTTGALAMLAAALLTIMPVAAARADDPPPPPVIGKDPPPPPDIDEIVSGGQGSGPATGDGVTETASAAEESAGEAAEEAQPAAQPLQQVVVGSAPVAGTFYPAAGAVCRQINRRQEQNRLRCLVEETGGSADNLARLRDGRLELAIVQSDWVYHAVAGSTADRAPPMSELRTLVLLQAQVMTLVANGSSGILELADLAGKRVAVGPPGSGVNEVGRALLAHLGFADSAELVELPIEEEASALCSGDIDAFLLPVAHPNGAVAEAVDLCGAILVGMTGEAIDRLVDTWPFYVPAVIPAEAYSTNGNEVSSFGLVATLVTTKSLSDEAAYAIVKALFESIEDLQLQHPSLALLSEESMSRLSMSAPLHEGALRYYQERGWR